jgi:hypothetical protein
MSLESNILVVLGVGNFDLRQQIIDFRRFARIEQALGRIVRLASDVG